MKKLKEYRCKHCGKLFFKGDLKCGMVEVKCKNCKRYSVFDGIISDKLFCFEKACLKRVF